MIRPTGRRSAGARRDPERPRAQYDQPRTLPILLLGILLGTIMLAPVSAHHTPPHTKRQLKQRYTKRQSNALFEQRFVRTIVVRGAGGPVANGNGLRAAVAAAPGNSPSERSLVLVEPGIYDLNGTPLTMKPFVSLAGAGRGTTILRCACGNIVQNAAHVVSLAADSELRSITVENRGNNSFDVLFGVVQDDVVGTSRIADARIVVSNALVSGTGIWTDGGRLTLEDVAVEASGTAANYYGVWALGDAELEIDDVEVAIEGGGTSYGIKVESVPADIRDADVRVENGGTNFGVFTHDAEVSLLDVRAQVGGGFLNHAVHNQGGQATVLMDGVEALAVGGGATYAGVHNLGAKSVTILNSFLHAKGETAYALLNELPGSGIFVTEVDHSKLLADGSAAERGVASHTAGGSYTVRINNSEIRTAQFGATVEETANFTVTVGGTHLHGGDTVGGVTCAGVWNEGYTFSASACL